MYQQQEKYQVILQLLSIQQEEQKMSKFPQAQKKLHQITICSPPAGYYSVQYDNKTHSIQSFSKEKRFIKIKNSQNPGPGSYFKKNITNYKKQQSFIVNKQDEKNNKIKYVPSIPSQSDCIYQMVGNGLLMAVFVPKDPIIRKNQLHNQINNSGKSQQCSENKRQLLNLTNSSKPQNLNYILEGTALKKIQIQNEENCNQINESTKIDDQFSISKSIPICEETNKFQNQSSLNVNNQAISIQKCLQLKKLCFSNDTPGPGQYTLVNLPKIKISKTSFNSSQKRFKQFMQNIQTRPGPANYNIDTKKDLTPFKLTQKRQCLLINKENIPGPGTYSFPSLTIPKHHSILKYQSSFGSGEKRFKVQNDIKPGPGQYQQQNKKQIITKVIRVSKSSLKINKLKKLVLKGSPPLNELGIESDIKVQKNRTIPKKILPNAVFRSSKRFVQKENIQESYIGPGYYDLKEINTFFNKSSNFLGLSNRKLKFV